MTDISLLLGHRLVDVIKQDYSWRFAFSGEIGLEVQCVWRLLVSGRLVITSEDHGQQFGLPALVDCLGELRRQIIGATVEDVKAHAGTTDLALHFGSDRLLEVIATSAGYEAWQLFAPGVIIVGQPGYVS